MLESGPERHAFAPAWELGAEAEAGPEVGNLAAGAANRVGVLSTAAANFGWPGVGVQNFSFSKKQTLKKSPRAAGNDPKETL